MSERTSLASLLAAFAVALAGLIPVVWLLASPAEDSAPEGEVVVVATTTTQPETVTVISAVPELEVPELDPAVVRVLQANGYAELVGEPSLEGALPEAVTRVLIDHSAVLTVVEQDSSAEEGS